jgi:MoaA/NifB/PqqE/SkfB family radical SAM enzyme
VNAKIQARKYENWKRCQSSYGLSPRPRNNAPLEIQLEVTTHCNLQCTMCPRTLFVPKAMHMSRDVLHKTFDLFPDAIRLVPFGIGEPLLYPYFWELVETAKRHDVEVCFTTNGTVLTREIARRLVDLNVDRIVFSIDGATAQTYEDIRQGGRFSTVIENLRTLASIKRDRLNALPHLGVAFVSMANNVREIPQLISLCAEVGVQFIGFQTLMASAPTWGASYDAHYEKASLANVPESELRPLFERCDELAKSHGLEVFPAGYFSKFRHTAERGEPEAERATSVRAEPPTAHPDHDHPEPAESRSLCALPWTTIYVSVTGLVRTCCYSSRVMGDLQEHAFGDIWKGGEFTQYRDQLMRGGCPTECVTCVQNGGNRRDLPPFATPRPKGLWQHIADGVREQVNLIG